MFVFAQLKTKQRVPRYLANLSNCWASIIFCYFIVGPMEMNSVLKLLVLVATIILGYTSFRHLEKYSVIAGTSLVGAGEIIIGISSYAESLPTIFPRTDTKHGGLNEITALFIFYQIFLTVFTLFGTWYQLKRFSKYHSDNVFKL